MKRKISELSGSNRDLEGKMNQVMMISKIDNDDEDF